MELLFMLFVFLLVWGLMGIKIVRQQNVAIVERFGKFSGVLTPGLNWILPPPISRIAHTADLRIIEIKSMVEIKTSDNAFVVMPTSLMIRVAPDKVTDSYYRLDSPNEQINRWVLNSVRSIAAKMKLIELFEDRQLIINSVTEDLEKKSREFGFIIEAVLIEQPTVSDEVQTASNRVVASQRELEAAQQEAQAHRVKIVAAAKAEAEGQIERAKGLSESRAILADSFKQNIDAISKTGADVESAMSLLLTVNRLDAMRDIGAHGNLIIMDTQNPNVALQSAMLKETQKP